METGRRFAGRFGYIGAGVGLALFAVFGLMQGAYLGGLIGLNLANMIAGPTAEPSTMQRLFAAGGMLAGVFTAGLMFVVGGACLGWLAGLAADSLARAGRKTEAQKDINP